MKKFAPFLCLLVGCNTAQLAREDQNKADQAVAAVRQDLEDVKQDLNAYEIEHHILEGKVTDLEATLHSNAEAARLEELHNEIGRLEKQIKALSKKQNEIVADIRQLTQHANDTTVALSQYKEKLTTLSRQETYIVKAGDSLEKIAREFATSVEALKTANKLKDDLIIVGSELAIPK